MLADKHTVLRLPRYSRVESTSQAGAPSDSQTVTRAKELLAKQEVKLAVRTSWKCFCEPLLLTVSFAQCESIMLDHHLQACMHSAMLSAPRDEPQNVLLPAVTILQVSNQRLQETVEVEFLEELGLVADAQRFKRLHVQANTKLLYAQQK